MSLKIPSLSIGKLKFQYHWLEKYPWIQYNSTTDGMLCQYCTHIYKEDESVLKHTQGAWISRPVSNWKKALDKMKTHAASDWHKLAKAKYDAERQIQTQGTVIHQLQQANKRHNEQLKQENCLLMKKLLRIMYFLCKQKIAHFTKMLAIPLMWPLVSTLMQSVCG